jgi:hypothetical protein
MLHSRTLNGTIEVEGREFEWELRREPQWCTADGWQGMLIGVREANGAGREALLQFPRPKCVAQRTRGPRHRPQVHRSDLVEAIKAALTAGWEPGTRGKAFHFEV